jgi:hypothetical protein
MHQPEAGIRVTGHGCAPRLEGGVMSSVPVLTMLVSPVSSDHLRDVFARYHPSHSFA